MTGLVGRRSDALNFRLQLLPLLAQLPDFIAQPKQLSVALAQTGQLRGLGFGAKRLPAAVIQVDPGALASKSRNTPYAGMTFPARVVATFLRGEPTVLDGKLAR